MKRFLAVLLSMFLLNAVASAQKFPDYPVRSASQYSSCQTKNGIRVAIEPVGEKDKQKKHFGTSFESQGLLPVLVVLENDSASSSLLLQRDLVTFRIEDDQTKGYSGGAASVRSKTGEVVAVAGAGGLVMFIGLKMIAGASEVKQNILVKELRSQTIAPGKAGSGFLYLPVGKPRKEKRKGTLMVAVSLDDKDEAIRFTFDLEVPNEK
ncbi:MAG: hypothetical protein ACRD9S_12830 [Pyrinomonadaceae bacterium]